MRRIREFVLFCCQDARLGIPNGREDLRWHSVACGEFVNLFYFAARMRASAFQMAELLISSAISMAELHLLRLALAVPPASHRLPPKELVPRLPTAPPCTGDEVGIGGGAEERRSGSTARLRLPCPCLFVWTDPSRSWGRWPPAAGAPRQQLPPIAASPCGHGSRQHAALSAHSHFGDCETR
jgi:hypothetical protein